MEKWYNGEVGVLVSLRGPVRRLLHVGRRFLLEKIIWTISLFITPMMDRLRSACLLVSSCKFCSSLLVNHSVHVHDMVYIPTISRHIANILNENELNEKSNLRFLQIAK